MGWGTFCHNINLTTDGGGGNPGDDYACDAIDTELTAVGNEGGFDTVLRFAVDGEYPSPNFLDPGTYDGLSTGPDWRSWSSLSGVNPPDVCDEDIFLGAGSAPWFTVYDWDTDGNPDVTIGAILNMNSVSSPTGAAILSVDLPGRQPSTLADMRLKQNGEDIEVRLNTTTGFITETLTGRWDESQYHVVVLHYDPSNKRARGFINGSSAIVSTSGDLRWTSNPTLRPYYAGNLPNGSRANFSIYRAFSGYGDIGYSAAANIYAAFLNNYTP